MVLVWFGLVFNFEVCLVSVWKLVELVAGKRDRHLWEQIPLLVHLQGVPPAPLAAAKTFYERAKLSESIPVTILRIQAEHIKRSFVYPLIFS